MKSKQDILSNLNSKLGLEKDLNKAKLLFSEIVRVKEEKIDHKETIDLPEKSQILSMVSNTKIDKFINEDNDEVFMVPKKRVSNYEAVLEMNKKKAIKRHEST